MKIIVSFTSRAVKAPDGGGGIKGTGNVKDPGTYMTLEHKKHYNVKCTET